MNENKFIQAYDDLMKFLYEAMDDTLHSAADALEIAKQKTLELGHLTQDEISKVADFVERDIEHAAHHLAANDDENLTEWFKFDIELLENFAIDAFMDLADKTRLELANLEKKARQNTYNSGDITSPGTFVCDPCGHEITLKSTGKIPVCPDCGSKSFIRS